MTNLEPAERPLASRSARVADLQQQVALRLILGGIVFFVVVAAAAYFYVFPPGLQNPRAAAETVHAYMLAGVGNEIDEANRLYSAAAIRAGSRDLVRSTLAQRELFEGYVGLQPTSFETTEDSGVTRAAFSARTFYSTGDEGTANALLIIESEAWRIDVIQVQR